MSAAIEGRIAVLERRLAALEGAGATGLLTVPQVIGRMQCSATYLSRCGLPKVYQDSAVRYRASDVEKLIEENLTR